MQYLTALETLFGIILHLWCPLIGCIHLDLDLKIRVNVWTVQQDKKEVVEEGWALVEVPLYYFVLVFNLRSFVLTFTDSTKKSMSTVAFKRTRNFGTSSAVFTGIGSAIVSI